MADSTQHLEVMDSFTTLQGEGPTMGTPAVFVRFRRCVLACSWCDTRYTWDARDPEYDNFRAYTTGELARRIEFLADMGVSQTMRYEFTKATGIDVFENQQPVRTLVLTGGEPMIWQRQFPGLLNELRTIERVEIETAGTLMPILALRVATAVPIRFNVSPKLPSSGNAGRELLNEAALMEYARRDSVFKFVVANKDDAFGLNAYVKLLTEEFGVSHNRIFVMPEGTTAEALNESRPLARSYADGLGIQLTDRAHVLAWGAKRGV